MYQEVFVVFLVGVIIMGFMIDGVFGVVFDFVLDDGCVCWECVVDLFGVW